MNYVTVVIPGKIYSATQSLGNKVSKPAIGVHTEEPFWSVNANNCSCSLATLCIKLLSMTYKLMMSRVIQYEWLWTGVHVNTKKINLSVEFTHNCKYLIIHSPQGFSGIIYNTGWGTLPDCLRCSLQVLKE